MAGMENALSDDDDGGGGGGGVGDRVLDIYTKQHDT